MTLSKHKLAAATAVAAAFSLAATPAAALDLPRLSQGPQAAKAAALEAENRRHHGHYDDDWDIDGDDILTGVLILGGIAAISAIANSGSRDEPVYQEPARWPEPDARYQAPAQTDYRSGGMAQAVDTCLGEVEASRGPVATVDRASRAGEGWYVAGELDGGAPYACWTDGSGQVTDIEAGDYGASYEAPEGDGAGVYDAELDRALTAMIDAAEIGPDGEIHFDEALGDQAFLERDSGRYWQISGAGQGDFRSRSLWDRKLETSGRKAWTAPHYYDSDAFADEPLRVAERTVRLPGSDVEWQFVVARARDRGA